MVVGFNHNIGYKGELFHVQTEDSGLANPHIITLLYRGGTIISSAKTSYADIIKADQLELVVESIMKEQHKEMMRRLKKGEFDARIFPSGASPQPQGDPAPAAASQPATMSQTHNETPSAAETRPATQTKAQGETPSPNQPMAPPTKRSLDEVILDYLITGEEK